MEKTLKYRRILLKLSGESLSSPKGFGIDPLRAEDIALRVKDVHELGVDVAIVIGAGNLWRGRSGLDRGMDRYGRLYGYAGDGNECPGSDGCDGAHGVGHTGAIGD
jgi:hypothetical protein